MGNDIIFARGGFEDYVYLSGLLKILILMPDNNYISTDWYLEVQDYGHYENCA